MRAAGNNGRCCAVCTCGRAALPSCHCHGMQEYALAHPWDGHFLLCALAKV